MGRSVSHTRVTRALRRGAIARTWILACLLPFLVSSDLDRGVVLEVDREHFSLRGLDLTHDVVGPVIRVAIGSPFHPTPSGDFAIRRIVLNPRWTPGSFATASGALPHPPSSDGPLGVAKIPLRGAVAIHGGAHRYSIGVPVTLGCVTTLDEDLLVLLEWLETRNALLPREQHADGEIHQALARPMRVVVR